MKKAFALLLTVFMFSCDDGDVTLQSFAFESQSIQKCSDNNLIFKIKNDELLLVDIPESNFTNTVTPDGTPREVLINSTNRIIYRKYSGNLSSTTICSILPPASPVVNKEWNATGGKILIETDEVFDTDGITIIGYTHNITFENVSFSGPDNTFSFTTYIFGDYETDL
ncbi:hypothetical protein [Flavobacterium sp.]|jgi:hypothetical protein|uniref:hypothetical protein n=1 Tax=Flavobacterium sp. TaxID=239 RepID=UPI002A8205DE|nr:hypothetical protein [Flavobacterium sp.]